MPRFGRGVPDPMETAEAVMAMAEPAPEGVQQWDYLQLGSDTRSNTLTSSDGRNWPATPGGGSANAVLLALGTEGWELVTVLPLPAVQGFWYIFKRPLVQDTP